MECGYVSRLAVSIDATVALFESHRVPRNLVVDDITARGLEVQTLGCDVGCRQQPDRIACIVERLAHVGALRERRPPVQDTEAGRFDSLGRQPGDDVVES